MPESDFSALVAKGWLNRTVAVIGIITITMRYADFHGQKFHEMEDEYGITPHTL